MHHARRFSRLRPADPGPKPTASSWGENGYYKVWLNEANAWMYPYQHDAERRMTGLANKFAVPSSEFKVPSSKQETSSNSELGTRNSELTVRILNQAARELLLAESSDWAFQIYQGTTVEYSSRRFRSHIHRFDLLAKMLDALSEPPAVAGGLRLSQNHLDLLAEIESRDNIFSEIDYRVYCS